MSAYFGTGANTGKVKRLRNFPDVKITACTVRGRPNGFALAARARRLDGAEAAAARRRPMAKNPIVFRCVVPLDMRIRRTYAVFYELSDIRPVRTAHPHVPAAEGKVVEHWACRDDVGQLAQLGLLPASGPPGAMA